AHAGAEIRRPKHIAHSPARIPIPCGSPRPDDSRSEIFLQEDQGQPAIEFAPDLGQTAALREAESLVQADAQCIVRVHATNQDAQSLAPRAFDQGGQQSLADPLSPPVLPHINGVFGSEPIARRRPERPITGVTHKLGALPRRQYGIIFLAGGKPIGHFRFAFGIFVPGRGGMRGSVVEDGGDGGEVVFLRIFNREVHLLPPPPAFSSTSAATATSPASMLRMRGGGRSRPSFTFGYNKKGGQSRPF